MTTKNKDIIITIQKKKQKQKKKVAKLNSL